MKNISANNHITTLISAPPLPFMLHHYHCCYTSLLLLICCLLALYYGKYTIFFTLMLLARHHKFTKSIATKVTMSHLSLHYHTTVTIPLPLYHCLSNHCCCTGIPWFQPSYHHHYTVILNYVTNVTFHLFLILCLIFCW